jgi:hypothetical protein
MAACERRRVSDTSSAAKLRLRSVSVTVPELTPMPMPASFNKARTLQLSIGPSLGFGF